MKENLTEIVFVVDRSGSMSSIAADMRGGFDTFIAGQKKTPGDCNVTLTQFDDHYDIVYLGKPLAEVPALVLEPRGSTALHDAIGRTIDATGARLAALAEKDRPSKVLFVIITDGGENASREYNHQRITDMIKTQRDTFSWDFIFIGANQDAVLAAQNLGIQGAKAMNFAANAAGAAGLYGGLSNQVSAYRGTKSKKGADAALDAVQASYNAAAGGDQAALDALTQSVKDADEP